MKVFVPGILVRTNYSWKTRNKGIDTNLWVRKFNGEYAEFGIIGHVDEGRSEPCLYIGVLADDKRFAEILMGEQKVIIRFELLEIYE